jgi:hypothetical protein
MKLSYFHPIVPIEANKPIEKKKGKAENKRSRGERVIAGGRGGRDCSLCGLSKFGECGVLVGRPSTDHVLKSRSSARTIHSIGRIGEFFNPVHTKRAKSIKSHN